MGKRKRKSARIKTERKEKGEIGYERERKTTRINELNEKGKEMTKK